MFNLFAPMPLDARKSRLNDYRSFLRERDGHMDLERRTLERREESIARFEQAPARVRDIDRDQFAELYARFDRQGRHVRLRCCCSSRSRRSTRRRRTASAPPSARR